MRRFWKFATLLALASVPLWGQSAPAPSGAAPSAEDGSTRQTAPPAPSSEKPAADQTTSVPVPPDSTSLVAIKMEKAGYPWEAQEHQLQGQVWIKILVSETGDVESAEIVSGDPILAKSAITAVKKWKFKPYIKNGKPVSVSAKLPFSFAFSQNVVEEKIPPAAAPATNPDAATNAVAPVNDAAGASSPNAESPKRVRVSSGVTTGLLIYKVRPVYPRDALQAHIEGTVILKARIDKEGRIADLQFVSGPKELAQAAIGAVQQWRYKPYLLLGSPVEVETQVQVNFQLR